MDNQLGPERLPAYRVVVFFLAVAAALGFGLMALNAPRAAPELKAQDILARLAPRPARTDVVLVAMDSGSVARYGAIKSWPRSVLANGLRRVEAGKPTSVVFDLALTRRSRTGDEGLWRTIANNRNVLLGMAYDADRPQNYTPDDIRSLIFLEKFALAGNLTLGAQLQQFPYYSFEPPVSDFTQSARGIGVFDRETDPDGVLRRARLFYRSVVEYPATAAPIRSQLPQPHLNDGNPVALTNLAFIAALGVFQVDKDVVQVYSGNNVRIMGNLSPPVVIPIDNQGRMLIRYAMPGAFPTYSFQEVAAGKVKPEVFAGKVVLIGATAPEDEATSVAQTPVGSMPRVEGTANALSTVLDRSYVQVVASHRSHLIGVMTLIGLVTGLVLMLVSGVRALIASLLLLLAYLALCWGLFAFGHLLIPILPGALVILTTLILCLLLSLGPFRPNRLLASPTYLAPPSDVVH